MTKPIEITAGHVRYFLNQILETKDENERRDLIISTFVRDIVCAKEETGYTIKITYNYTENPSAPLYDSSQRGSQKSVMVEMRGVEPLSENIAI